ncbi:MAG: hypothetical protein K6T99_05020 [Armatimonadetes bacterium]|nr:hypothetical protein [Armatimonadota bacterium]
MAENKLLGEIMIDMGFASREVIMECLKMQTEIHQKGLDPVPIGRLLIKTGHITMEQLEKALAKQAKSRLPS